MPTKIILVLALLTAWSTTPAAAAAEKGAPAFTPPAGIKIISVTDFGARSDDGINDADALRAAVAYARAHPGMTLVFPPGTYDLRDEEAVRIQDEWLTGTRKGNPEKTLFAPYAPHVRGLDFNGSRNLTIEAVGAVLLCDGWMEPVSLADCRQVTLKGLTIDYKRKPFSEGIITEIREGSFDAVFGPEFPLNEGIPLQRMMVWDAEKNRVTGPAAYNPAHALIAPQTLRIQGGTLGGKKGDIAMFIHGFHARPAIFINEARNIVLEDITIHAQEGMGVVGNRVHNLTVKRLRVVPAKGCRQSTNTDATHYTSCTGLLRYEDCEFQGQGDDAINVHNYYQEITRTDATNRCEARVPLWYTHAGVLDYYDVGDTLELVARDSLKPERTCKVVAATPHPNHWRQELTLDAPLPADTSKYYLANATRFPRVELVRCTMRSHLARSVLIKAREALVEDCVFDQCTGTAIHVGAEGDWKESGPCDDLIIRRCKFIRNGRGEGTVDGACAVAVQIKAAHRGVPGIHGKILIEKNVIEGENAQRGIYVTGADEATVRDNSITGCTEPVKVEATRKVHVERNSAPQSTTGIPLEKSRNGEKLQELSALNLTFMTIGYGRPSANASLGGEALKIAGVAHQSGIATHAKSDLFIRLDGKATYLHAVCGVDDDSLNTGASVRFSVFADFKKVWESPLMKAGMNGIPVDLPLAGVKLLQLHVDDGGDGISSDHADWASAAIHFNGIAPVAIGEPPPPPRWSLGMGCSVSWKVAGTKLPHADFIEQGGRRAGQKIWYKINADQTLTLERDVVWPSLRIFPNDTHGSLIKHYGVEAGPKIFIDGSPLGLVKIADVLLDGTFTVVGAAGEIGVKRVTFPSFDRYAVLDRWTLTNQGNRTVAVAVAPILLSAEQDGPYGMNVAEVSSDAPATAILTPGKSLDFTITFSARLKQSPASASDGKAEELSRRKFIDGLNNSLVLETPDPVLDRAFTFAKWRVAEAMNDTRGGLMLAPGNLRYYAATWCNDNVEYAGPFFPFLGDEGGNKGSINTYRQYMPFMKPSYERIPCSIIAEGTATWGPFDRGDAAMFAYGASRFAMAYGDRTIAEELWKGIEWSLEYCRRKQTPEGVIASDKDELEGRLPAGNANLTTSSLCYGALRSAADLARVLGKSSEAFEYRRRADALEIAIEKHFGSTVEGFQTYRYYDGNTRLRSWICMPLSMGIFKRNSGTIGALFSEKMWTVDGLASQSGDKVFWDRSTLYALRAVFQAGETTKALDFLQQYTNRRLLGEHVPYAVEAYPEGGQGHLSSESALYCRIFIEGMFGIRPTGLRSFECTPHLPDGWPSMALRHIKAFGGDFDVEVGRSGENLCLRVSLQGKTVTEQTLRHGESFSVIL